MTTPQQTDPNKQSVETEQNLPQETDYGEKYPQYKYFVFPDGSIYYGETATVTKEGKIVPNPNEVTDEELKKTFQIVRHGYGIQLYELKDNQYTAKYEGNWYLNKKKGKSKATYPDGSIYEGEFDNDVYEGQGRLIWKQGYKYTGQWKNGRMEGEGVFKHYDGHVLQGTLISSYYYHKENGAFINPFLTADEMEAFKLKNIDFTSKSKNQFEKFSRENITRVSNPIQLVTAIDETYKANKIPLIIRSENKKIEKDEILSYLHGEYREIDLRYSYMKLHGTSLGLNTEIFNEIKQNVTEAMNQGYVLVLNFDDCKEKYEYTYDPDIREFYGNMMLSPFMWNPSLFSQPKCNGAHLNNRTDLKMDKNFKLICYSKFLANETIQEHDLLNDIEKRFEKCFPLVNMNVLIYSEPQNMN
jgi:hypothetical protein